MSKHFIIFEHLFYLFRILLLCLQAVSESVTQQDDDTVLKCLIELAENVPKFLRPQVENVLTFAMKVITILFSVLKAYLALLMLFSRYV